MWFLKFSLHPTEDGVGDIVLESVEHVRDNDVISINTLGQAENKYKADYPSSLPIQSHFEDSLQTQSQYLEQLRSKV